MSLPSGFFISDSTSNNDKHNLNSFSPPKYHVLNYSGGATIHESTLSKTSKHRRIVTLFQPVRSKYFALHMVPHISDKPFAGGLIRSGGPGVLPTKKCDQNAADRSKNSGSEMRLCCSSWRLTQPLTGKQRPRP